jgi:beta-barrel assembly-enhancing protease
MNRRFFCSSCASLFLGACAEGKLPVDMSSFGIGKHEDNGSTLTGVGTLPPPPQRTWPDAQLDLNKARADGWGLVPMPDMEAYLNNLLATVKKTAGTPGYPGSVHIIGDTSLNANSSAAGNIFVSVGWLQSAESEDEIFAILSHEFGHIYLNHHAIYDARTAGDTSIEVVSLAWTLANKQPGPNAWTGIDNIGVVQTLGTRVLFPAWQRSVEEQADRFGATISLRCNYSYVDGFKAFFERVITYDQQAKERRKTLRDQQAQTARAKASQDAQTKAHAQPLSTGVNGSAAQYINKAGTLSSLSDIVSSYTSMRSDAEVSATQNLFDIQQMIENQIDDQMESLHDDHGDPAAREQNLTELVRPVMGDKRPDPRTDVWDAARRRGSTPQVLAHYNMLTQVQDLQAAGQYRQALQVAQNAASGVTGNDAYPNWLVSNLMSLSNAGTPDAQAQVLRRNLNSRDRSWKVQTTLANHIGKRDPKQGESFLLQQFDYFEKASLTWPGVISYYRDHGDPKRAKELVSTCTGKYPEMRTACLTAAQTPPEQRKSEGANEFDKAKGKIVDWAKGILK